MKISVCMISYNQEEYIAQAILGVLEQKTNFLFELVISDDCSTDNTYAIAEKYYALYPNVIRLIKREKNVGMMNNFISTLNSCLGEYIAICEGDDYWTNPFKLQKQVDFLDANAEYSICFTRVYELIEDKKQISVNNPWDEEKTFTIQDLAQGNFINTLSVVYRNGLIKEYPSWFDKSPVGDYVIHMLNARHGLIKYFPEVMGVYRMYSGTWSINSTEVRLKKFALVLNFLLLEDFDSDVKEIVLSQKNRLMSAYYEILLEKNDFSFLEDLKLDIGNESEFIKYWMLHVYPNKLQSIYSSKAFRLINLTRKLKNNLTFWK